MALYGLSVINSCNSKHVFILILVVYFMSIFMFFMSMYVCLINLQCFLVKRIRNNGMKQGTSLNRRPLSKMSPACFNCYPYCLFYMSLD